MLLAVLLFLLCCGCVAVGQQTGDASSTVSQSQQSTAVTPEDARAGNAFKRFLVDEKTLWTSPAKVRSRDFKWLFPVGVATTILIATDADVVTHNLPSDPNTIRRAQNLSDYGAAGFVGLSGAFYLGGLLTKNDHARETGWLSGAAIGHALLVNTGVKYMTGRERPLEGDRQGHFWQGGNSFPSDHSAIAWSAASVIAHEYPGKLTQFLVYGGATTVSISRVIGQKHFPSDVFVGSTLGWLIGRQVYRMRHNPELSGGAWGSFVRGEQAEPRTAANMGSAYVPIGSWVYLSFDRLEALGYVRSAFAPMRPWTRLECVRLLGEAVERFDSEPESQQRDSIASTIAELQAEFRDESLDIASGINNSIDLESVYSRFQEVSGPPLTDGYHFGQTIINDYGRPYGRGFSMVTGVSGRAVAGPFVFYARGEYQHAPGIPAISDQVANATAQLEGVVFRGPILERNTFRLVEGYVGVNLHNLQLSFGKQTLWWGPGEGSPMLMGNNAEPFTMFRASTVSPIKLPSIFKYLGPMRTEFFVGELAGHRFVNTENGIYGGSYGPPVDPQAYTHGVRLSFKPTPNFTFSASRTNIMGGPVFPFTPARFWKSLIAQNNYFGSNDPGDNRGSVDFTYRVPGIRDWLTLYLDAFTEDQPTPLLFPERAAFRTGFFMPKVPGLNRLSLRGESAVTDIPASILFPGYHYFNVRYLSGYTNRGNLLGSTVGRQGVGGQLWARYWFSPRNTVEFSYRSLRASSDFLQGGAQDDFSGTVNVMLRRDLELRTFVQFERWHFPLLDPKPKSNVTASVQFTWTPKWRISQKASLK